MSKPNPGSKEAQDQGCTCPIMDNHYGKGIPSDSGPLFWYSDECPLHGGSPALPTGEVFGVRVLETSTNGDGSKKQEASDVKK